MSSPLTSLPNEVIQVILAYLPPLDNIALQQTCRHFATVANQPLLWRTYCRETFKWWDKRHAVKSRLRDTSYVEWKDLFARRHRASRATRHAVDKIVTEELGRLDSLRIILEAGYDSKQDLLDMFWNAALSPNHLAQRSAISPVHDNTALLTTMQILESCSSRLSAQASRRGRVESSHRDRGQHAIIREGARRVRSVHPGREARGRSWRRTAAPFAFFRANLLTSDIDLCKIEIICSFRPRSTPRH
jgi:hypothetical protein